MSWYSSIVEWIHENDGFIHPSLILKEIDVDARGIYANEDVEKGTLLIRLPSKLAVSGSKFPSTYMYHSANEDSERLASPWLRCVTALLSTYINEDRTYEQYIKSLPEAYETLIHKKSWSDDDVQTYLAGTSIGKMVLQDRQSNTLRTRFESSVKPYMEANGLINQTKVTDDELFRSFQMACACVSTRGFHLKENNKDVSSGASVDAYAGPFLLPFIDLLNHSSNQKDKCTTLQRRTDIPGQSNNGMAQDGFFMTAERDVKKDEEILHSYGNGLTSCQLLQTFGFVESYLVDRAIRGAFPGNIENDVTPVILSKEMLIQACAHISLSKIPQNLEKQITTCPELLQQDFDTWELPSAPSLMDRNSNAVKKKIPDEIIVNFTHPLSDDLITLCSLQFLPDEAFDEICEVHDNGDSTLTMLSSDILEDFFLGSLVLRAIQHAIQIRLSDYPAVKSPSVIALDDGALDDATLLKVLTSDATNKGLQPSKEVIHGIYGLTLRIEEKACLNQLQESCLELLKSLGHPEGKNEQRNLEANDKDGNHSDFSSKRRKV
jgi:hypothetical protein